MLPITDVLVVGAGPTGLMLAGDLAAAGVSCAVLERRDKESNLTRAFGVHIDEEGLALRGTFVINPEGTIKTQEIHDNAIAREMKETLRKLKAAQYVANNPGQVCPAKWKDGEKTIKPSLELVGKI